MIIFSFLFAMSFWHPKSIHLFHKVRRESRKLNHPNSKTSESSSTKASLEFIYLWIHLPVLQSPSCQLIFLTGGNVLEATGSANTLLMWLCSKSSQELVVMKRRLLGEGKKSQKSIHDESIIMLQLNEGNHFFSFMNEKKKLPLAFSIFFWRKLDPNA